MGNTIARCFIIEAENLWLDPVREYATTLNRPAIFQSSSLAYLAMRLRRESLHPDGMTPLAIEGLMLEIIAEACRKRIKHSRAKPPRWLEQTKEMLHECFLEPLTLSGIAETVGVHPVYLASVFRRYYRCSVGEYKRQLQVEFACGEIARTDAPLSQIALAAGYCDQAHFSRMFKRVTGMTPAEYRASSRA
ncbi:MAG TPA: AraC family transcriptional regulator [Blastocatellia bacterium]|nr:AraC family transcriptional regulator [Blastocatellia bacterium]